MKRIALAILMTFIVIWSSSAQSRNTISLRSTYGIYFRPHAGSVEKGRAIFPLSFRNWNIPEISADYTRWLKNKQWGWGFSFAMRRQGFSIDRNFYTPVSRTKILESDILEYWSTTFGYGFNLKYRKGKYQFRADVLINIDWIPRTTQGWEPTTPENYPIYGELIEPDLGFSWYWDFFGGAPAGANAASLGLSVDRQLWKGLHGTLGLQFQLIQKDDVIYRYRAALSRDPDTPNTGWANDVFFRRRIEVLKLGLSYDINWGSYEKKDKHLKKFRNKQN